MIIDLSQTAGSFHFFAALYFEPSAAFTMRCALGSKPFNGPFSWNTRVGRYQKGKTNLDFTEARDSEWQWHQLGHMQVCTSLQTNNHASTPPLSFFCPSCHPTNSVEALTYQQSVFR